MLKTDGSSARRQVRNLLAILIGGVVFGVALALVFLYYYNPTGHYIARNVLLSPTTIDTLTGPQIKGKPFQFDKILYTYFDDSKGQWVKIHVEIQEYKKFYDLISKDQSYLNPESSVKSLFDGGKGASLALIFKQKAHEEQFVQQVNIVEQDYYRIQLNEDGGEATWAYFTHPSIYQTLMKLFKAEP